jgi:hypothetical protein
LSHASFGGSEQGLAGQKRKDQEDEEDGQEDAEQYLGDAGRPGG